jgi:hypothetical protein
MTHGRREVAPRPPVLKDWTLTASAPTEHLRCAWTGHGGQRPAVGVEGEPSAQPGRAGPRMAGRPATRTEEARVHACSWPPCFHGGTALGLPPACPSSLLAHAVPSADPSAGGRDSGERRVPSHRTCEGGPDVRARRSGRGAGPAGQGRRRPSRPASPASFGTRLHRCAQRGAGSIPVPGSAWDQVYSCDRPGRTPAPSGALEVGGRFHEDHKGWLREPAQQTGISAIPSSARHRVGMTPRGFATIIERR